MMLGMGVVALSLLTLGMVTGGHRHCWRRRPHQQCEGCGWSRRRCRCWGWWQGGEVVVVVGGHVVDMGDVGGHVVVVGGHVDDVGFVRWLVQGTSSEAN